MARNTTFSPHISVIIPVYEEAAAINIAIRGVRNAAGSHPLEIIVVDGGPGQGTLAVIEDSTVVKVDSRPGRGVQMNSGAAVATGDVLLFLHADTRLPDGWPHLVLNILSDQIRAGAFSLAMDSDRLALAVVAFFANLRTRWERVPYGDQAHFFNADFFKEMGGYADIPLMEDVELFMRIRQRGERIALVGERVHTSPRRYEADGIVRRVLSNWWLRIRYGLGVSPGKLAKQYRPHGVEHQGDEH